MDWNLNLETRILGNQWRLYYPLLLCSKRVSPRWPYFGLYFYPCSRSISFLIRNNKDIKSLNLFDHLFLIHSLCRWSLFFLENKESIEEFLKIFTLFSYFSGLKPNISKYKICGLDPLKGMKIKVCGMQSVDLTRDTIKILGVYFLYNINQMKPKN